ncbi:CvpA family protein [Dokdonella sp.]|uniref:CvpA family protein n=1 Tax=Dokdonella sp. TaxID=2291710 RepID=UPI001B1FB2AE|nr:CvpA family protein [Dokdonella sp.]MBO9662348.1 CvpA family protein [Dokdonella sp.]
MNWADYAILAILGLSVLMGLWRGFIGEVLALAVWVCAFWVAWMLGPALAEQFSGSISTPSVRILIGYALCFIAVLIAGAIVTFLMRKLVEGSGLSGSDRLLGMVFGLVRGLALVVLIVLLLGFTPFAHDPWWRESRLLPSFEQGAHWVRERLPAEVARYLEPAAGLIRPPESDGKPPAATNPSST